MLLYEIETNQTKKTKGTPKYMTTTFIKNDPPKALQFFEDKMAFTTGPIELSHALNEKQDIVLVDVRAA